MQKGQCLAVSQVEQGRECELYGFHLCSTARNRRELEQGV